MASQLAWPGVGSVHGTMLLDPREHQQMLRIATRKLRRMPPSRRVRMEPQDLVQSAMLAAIATRERKAEVAPLKFVFGIIDSLASHAKTRREIQTVALSEEHTSLEEQGDAVAKVPDPLHHCEVKSELARIVFFFREDPEVQQLIESLAEGLGGPEFCAAHGWTQTKYETVCKRMRRGARKAVGG